ncbi:MAG: molybdate ABC transporter permease subunit [Brevirhabdus sp.]
MIDFDPIWLTIRLAATTAALLIVLAMPLAWWLANTRARIKPFVEALTALPLVLPPTVLGFYLLVLFSPNAPIGAFWVSVTGDTLTFSFTGLVVASMIYSLPFAVQPLQAAFEAVGRGPLEAAASLGARPLDRFLSVALPLSRRGVLTGLVLSFAHTMGEFGVVLMVGGNIPGETRVIAIDVYSRVEVLDYAGAHVLSAGLLMFSFAVLSIVYVLNRRGRVHVG